MARSCRSAAIRHPLQLYSLATPNFRKVMIMLEELLALGHRGAEYDPWLIKIDGDQFGSGFVAVKPNSKIPALMDRSGPKSFRVFESGSILLQLAEKSGALLPKVPAVRAELLSWLFRQMGSAPYLGGGLGNFHIYAPTKIKYAIDRFATETKCQLDVLDRHLADNEYLAGSEWEVLIYRQSRAPRLVVAGLLCAKSSTVVFWNLRSFFTWLR